MLSILTTKKKKNRKKGYNKENGGDFGTRYMFVAFMVVMVSWV